MPDTDAEVRPAVGLQIKQARQQRRWSQAKLAYMLNRATGFRFTTTAKYVSRWERGERTPGYEWRPVIERVLGLDLAALPDTASGLGAAAGSLPSGVPAEIRQANSSGTEEAERWDKMLNASDETRVEVGAVRRRDLLSTAGATLLGLSTEGLSGDDLLTSLSRALTTYKSLGSQSRSLTLDLDTLSAQTKKAKILYQACEYRTVLRCVPSLLSSLTFAGEHYSGDEKRYAHALSADAHHTASSVLLKLGDVGLASLAADRSIRAAEESEDPLSIGSAARIVAHTLMASGHTARAVTFAKEAAEHLSRQGNNEGSTLSVYGSLLLRGAVAAGKEHDRGIVIELLDEATETAARIGGDHNLRWTAFGPTNVLLHRVNLLVELGDAGSAIDYARKIDPRNIVITERQAGLYIDVAKAFMQWGKFDRAYQALRMAAETAPEEITQRPSVSKFTSDLISRAPTPVAIQIRGMLTRTGCLDA